MVKKNEKESRSKIWNVMVYPESAPENWKEVLVEEGIFFVCSPLHDKDVDKNGEIKKAHWHVLLCFTSNKTYKQALEVAELLNAPAPQRAKSTGGSIRYMIHIDSRDKYQYKKSDIEVYGNIDIEQYFRISSSDRYELVREMITFIDDNNLKEFKDLMDYAMRNRFDDWFPLLCDNSAYVVQQYLKSNRHKADR
ncbi:TPA: replication protein [Staphylococcus aureus]|nr:replication protein [Staphylococcus aureus]HCQ9727010.1 replication protein [Acinetobacter baumannii]HBI1396073.1 replication protein [Staphylococcus aureus]HBI1409844.1 replication protein [Staphylococcus aureus]HBI1412733.1 replication protein [Staphylococcus aureus]